MDARAASAHARGDVPQQLDPAGVPLGDDADHLLLRRASGAVVVLVTLLGVVTAVALLRAPGSVMELIQGALMAGVALAIVLYRRADVALQSRRLTREAAFTRILQGLSRSVSPDAVVDAIVAELRETSGADHVVISRLRLVDGVLETTLVSANPGVPTSRTEMSGEALTMRSPAVLQLRDETASMLLREPPASAAADEIARLVRSAYGLAHTRSAALLAEGRPVGALVLSQRTKRPWSPAAQRLLDWAALEVSAALARAYAYEEAEARANIDALTKLPNRRYFDQLGEVIRFGRRAGDSVGLLMIDIDNFKRLNDRYGHATGDRVLRAVADAIATSVRGADTPARYGGEEFAVVLRRADARQAVEVAERVRGAIAAIPPGDLEIAEPVTVSVGVAVSAERPSFGELVEEADRALYVAKRRGRDQVVLA